MIFVYKDRIIQIEWSIFRGTSQVPEDFSRALVKLFLVGNYEKYAVPVTAEGGTLVAQMPQDLPDGAYSLEAIWVKNYNNLFPVRGTDTPSVGSRNIRYPGPCHNDYGMTHPWYHRSNDRCLMRSRKEYVFAVTSYPGEETAVNQDGYVTIKISSAVATYGYDGLSAYEIAVMRGDFNGTEKDFLAKNIINNPDNEDLTIAKEGGYDVIKFADKEYNALNHSGLGRVYLRKNIVSSINKNILTQDMIKKTNTRYIIQYDYDLNEKTITIPEGCVLQFEGGSFSNGIITGNNTKIKAGLEKIFSTSVVLNGSWTVPRAYPEWFGAIGNGSTDCTKAIYLCVKFFNKTVLSPNKYAVTNLIFDFDLYSKEIIGEVNYTNRTRTSSSLIHIGNGDILCFNGKLHNAKISNLYIEINDNTTTAINFNYDGSSSYNKIDAICIRGTESKLYANTTAISLGSGFANDFSRLNISSVNIAFKLEAKASNAWITPLNIGGDSKSYIIDCNIGIYAELGNNILINNILFERTNFPINIKCSSIIESSNNFNYITKYFVENCYFERCLGDDSNCPIHIEGINNTVKKASLIFKDSIIYDCAAPFFELNNGYLLVDNKEGGLDYNLVKELGGINLYYFTNDVYSQQQVAGYVNSEIPFDSPNIIRDYIYRDFRRLHVNKEILLGNNGYYSNMISRSVYNRTALIPTGDETSKSSCISIFRRKGSSSTNLYLKGTIQWDIHIIIIGGSGTEYECLYTVYGGTGNTIINTVEHLNQISNSSAYNEDINFTFAISYDSGTPINLWYLIMTITSETAGKLSDLRDIKVIVEEKSPYRGEEYDDIYNNSELPTGLTEKAIGYSVFSNKETDFIYWNGIAWVNMDGTALE